VAGPGGGVCLVRLGAGERRGLLFLLLGEGVEESEQLRGQQDFGVGEAATALRV
jgi:hypothetical protein